MEELIKKWDEIKDNIRQDLTISDVTFDVWMRPLKIKSINNDTITLSAPENISEKGIDLIKSRYEEFLKIYIKGITGRDYELNYILVNDNDEIVYSNEDEEEEVSFIPGMSEEEIERKAAQAHLIKKYTFDNFVVGDNNKMAISAAFAVMENPGSTYNPLFIWGGPGLGKTHLMNAIGHEMLHRYPEMNVIYVTSETFANEIIERMRSGKAGEDQTQAMKKIRERYRNTDLLLFDDVQFLQGKNRSQEEFFHTFNELHAAGKAIIISSDKPPKSLEVLEERMISRFSQGIIVDIGAPDYETRVAILKKLFEVNHKNSGIVLSDEIISYLASNIRSNVRELEGALNQVINYQNAISDKDLSTEMLKEVIKDFISPDEDKIITCEHIIEKVSSYYNVKKEDILSKKRTKDIAYIRQIIMYLCNDMTSSNIVSIGKAIGGRDHATVIYGSKRIKEEMNSDKNLVNKIEELKKAIING